MGKLRFAKVPGVRNTVGNVKEFTDANEQSTHPDFMMEIDVGERPMGASMPSPELFFSTPQLQGSFISLTWLHTLALA